MAEKSDKPAKNGTKKKQNKVHIVNKEAYERVNFLYQAAHLMLAENPDNIEISRFYTSTAKSVTEKLVLKIDPAVKRTLCKCCHILLVPGVTAKFRIKGKREKHVVVTCLTCKTIKRWRCKKSSSPMPRNTTAEEQNSNNEEEFKGTTLISEK